MTLEEELSLISAMYSNSKEFVYDKNSSAENLCFLMNINVEDIKLSFSCRITDGYPLTVPTVCIHFPSLQKSKNSELQKDLHHFLLANELIGQPLLCILIDWLKDNISNYLCIKPETSTNNIKVKSKYSTCVLQLDHMRSKSRYIKHLQLFAKELDVCGYVIFITKHIYIILQGLNDSIKEFIVKLKTQKVDLDSSGHPCKERMLKVLGETSDCSFSSSCNNLVIKELGSFLALENFFKEIKLCKLYEKFIVPSFKG